jgi:hypothetical protein
VRYIVINERLPSTSQSIPYGLRFSPLNLSITVPTPYATTRLPMMHYLPPLARSLTVITPYATIDRLSKRKREKASQSKIERNAALPATERWPLP